MQKNVASQKWIVFAFEGEGGTNPGEPVTGDAANITANLRLDGGAANAVDDTNPTELEDGYYVFDITQAESNADLIVIAPESSTANVNVIGVPGAVWTTPASFNSGALATASALATVDGIVDDILVDTAEIGAAGAGLTEAGGTGDQFTAIPWNATWDAEVESEVTDALNAYDPPTRTEATADKDAVIAALAIPTQNEAFNDIPVYMVDATDHVTPETGLTLMVQWSIDGGAFGSATGTAAEVGNGLYQFDASAADMNGGVIVFRFTAAGADPYLVTISTKT